MLLFVDWFEPAYKAGGPIRSSVNFVEHMKGEYEIYVFTSDRDLGQSTPLSAVLIDQWTEFSPGVKVMYASPGKQGLNSIRQLIKSVAPEFIYLNSVFSKSYTIYPLLAAYSRGLQGIKWVMSPRGMLRPSALKFKALKKRFFLNLFRISGMSNKILFLATDQHEAEDVRKIFPRSQISIASNFGTALLPNSTPVEKEAGILKVIFVGRIHPIKNLHFLLQAMKAIRGKVELTIVGVLEDRGYWQQCEEIIRSYPSTIEVAYKGDLPFHELGRLTAGQHIFALPTHGENFGHAIFEALNHGKPVLISDQTPWRKLEEQKAGWDLPLDSPEEFTKRLQQAIDWSQQEYNQWSQAAWELAMKAADDSKLKQAYKKIFD